MDKHSLETYLKAVYCLSEGGEQPKTVSIARVLNIKPASVTEMLDKLVKGGYVEHQPYKSVKLTKEGRKLAQKVVRKERLIKSFLYDVLKVKKEQVKLQACGIEHVIDDKTDEHLCISLNRPMKDPIEDKPIPHCEKKMTCKSCLSSNSSLKRIL
ncbi:metal-dependent transcriptional regulator [Candidatus Micrarchaeota archaeon]|nr:metal-dependent transcriptional regulator [Candidatus Micrarchaeota archaeon]